jgi:hypothetical protein
MDQELFAYLEKRFQGMEERFQGMEERFQGMEERFQQLEEGLESVREDVRHARVEIEGMHDDVRLLADGVATNTECLTTFRVDVAKEFAEVRATMRLHYKDLDRRVSRLEASPRPQKH